MTPAIINQVHKLAELDEIPKGLKIMNKTDEIIFDSTWIAVVDFDEYQFQDENYESNIHEEMNENIREEMDDNLYEEIDEMNEIELADILDEAPQSNRGNKVQDNNQDNESLQLNEENNVNEEATTNNEDEEDLPVDNIPDQNEDEEQVDIVPGQDDEHVDNLLEEQSSDSEYEPSDQEDISLEADPEEDFNPTIRRTVRVRIPNRKYQDLHAKAKNVEEYSKATANVIGLIMSH